MIKDDLENIRFEFRNLGLDVKVSKKKSNYFCRGKLNKMRFTITISSKSDKNGVRDFMIAFFFDQENEDFVSLLSSFIGYKLFCMYLYRGDPKGFVNYEGDKRCPEQRLIDLKYKDDVFLVQRFKESF